MDVASLKDISEYKVAELKEMCKKLNLPVSGTKQVLYDRIANKSEPKEKKEKKEKKSNKSKKKSGEIKLSAELDKKWDELVYNYIDAGFDPSDFRSSISHTVKTILDDIKKKDVTYFNQYLKKDDDKLFNKMVNSLDGYSQEKIKQYLRKKAVDAFNKLGESIYEDWKMRH